MLGGLRGAVSRFVAGDGLFLAGGLAFFLLLSLIPLVLLGVSAAGFVLSGREAAQEVVGQLTSNLPVYRKEVTRVLLRIVETRKLSGLVGTLVLVLFAMPLFGAARLVMHRMLDVRSGAGLVRSLVRDAGMVLLLGLFLFGSLGVTWTVDWLRQWVLEPAAVPLGWIRSLTIAVSLGLSTLMFYLGFRYVPYRKVRAAAALAGAVMTAGLWEVAKQLFRLYIRQVGLYDQIYGPLAILVAFVMFLYYSAVVFVFGAAFVAALDTRRR